LAAEKSSQARRRVVAAITAMQREGAAINFNTICRAARVSKTFLYDPKHSDLAERIRSLRQTNSQSSTSIRTNSAKSDSAKDAQIARFKERTKALEEQVRALQEEIEVLYGKLSTRQL
jgi:hypothetical protein